MPELPEVEIFKRFAEDHAIGKTIADVEILHPKILENVSADDLIRTVQGHKLDAARRHGKNLFLRVKDADAWLLLHFGMTGFLVWYTDETEITTAYGDRKKQNGHLRVRFDLADGSHFGFDEQRMFGKMSLIDSPDKYIREHDLGPDALDMPFEAFREGIQSRKGQIKPLLMDQSFVAGVGNVYADEALYQCRLHPGRRADTLTDGEIECLHAQMRDVLIRTVDCEAERKRLPNDYLTHHRHKKGKCGKHGVRLEIVTVGGRTTYFCPKCQPLNAPKSKNGGQ